MKPLVAVKSAVRGRMTKSLFVLSRHTLVAEHLAMWKNQYQMRFGPILIELDDFNLCELRFQAYHVT